MARRRRSETAATVKALKIVSGGQTGVDRAALDIALKHGIECGGWCPAGRFDEFGRIPERYPLRELESTNKGERSVDRPGGLETATPWEKLDIFAQRTLANVRDSDGTIIIYCDQLRGGTAFTVECCKRLQRPCQLIDATQISVEEAAKLIADFVRKNKIDVLNVAGPRQSGWPKGYDYVSQALDRFLNSLTSKSACRSKVTRSAKLSPGRGARRSKRGSARQTSRSKRH